MFRILIVTNGWGVKEIGGGELHMLYVLKNWSKENYISIIMPRSGYRYSREILSKEYQVYLSSPEEQLDSGTIELFFYLRRILRSSLFRFKQSPDIVIASSHLLYDVLPALILRTRLKSKLVVYVHGFFLKSNDKPLWRIIATLSEKISLFLCKKADLIFVVNQEIKDGLVAKGFQADKIVLTGNGIEHDLINSVRVNEKKFDCCFCGRIHTKKGIFDLVDVWERVIKYFPESKLVIVGNGPEYPDLLKMIKNKALEKNITLTGILFGERKISVIKSSRVFVSPSYGESWGIAVSEAMACGLAVVCYNLSAYKIFGNDIIKVGVGNKEEMVKAIVDLLADKNKQQALAANGKQVVANMLNWDNISADQLKEITKLLSTR